MSWVSKLFNWVTASSKRSPGSGSGPPPVNDPQPTARRPETVYAKVDFLVELIREAERCVGVTEHGGNNKGAEVEHFQRAVDGKAQGEPWCAAFVQSCLKEVAAVHGATLVAHVSEHCMTIWRKTPGVHRYRSPKAGYLIIWNYEGSTNGHIGIVRRVIDEFTIETIEGNTGPDDKAIEREGDGVYRKVRSTKSIGKMKLVGFIAPFNPESVERPEIKVS